MKPATEILLSAAFVLTPEENWTQGTLARNERGIRSSLEAACQFCMVGAVLGAQRARGDSSVTVRTDVWNAIQAVIGGQEWSSPSDFNDFNTHADVLSTLYKAAELAEAS